MVDGFHDVQFPPLISYGAVMTSSRWDTTIISDFGKTEQRIANWASSQGKYTLSKDNMTSAELAIVNAFHRCRKGRAYSFRFKDWSDYIATLQVLTASSSKIYPLIKTYTDTGGSCIRTITKPVSGTLHVFDNGVEKTEGANPAGQYTVNYSTGVITFNAEYTIIGAITATFEFDIHARFASDECPISMEYYEGNSWENIEILELPE